MDEYAEVGLEVTLFYEVVNAGATTESAPEFVYPEQFDPYMFCYTSGTTGNPKGVKMTHEAILRTSMNGYSKSVLREDDAILSYMPYPHAYE